MCAQLALQAVLDYEPPDGGSVSAVSYSWGLDERNTDRSEMDACDELMKALLDKVRRVESGLAFRVSACHVGDFYQVHRKLYYSKFNYCEFLLLPRGKVHIHGGPAG